MEFLFAYFVTLLVGLATNIGEAWDALPELAHRSNLGLGKRTFGITVLVADLSGLALSGWSLVPNPDPAPSSGA
jgi:hypothetical protein